MGQPWPILDFVKPQRKRKLPVVLSRAAVERILGCLRWPHYRACLSTIYACGLRLQEGRRLQVGQIDSRRMTVYGRGGEGRKARYVPLAERPLALLRRYWLSHRNPVWLFPTARSGGMATVRRPRDESGVQKAFRQALEERG